MAAKKAKKLKWLGELGNDIAENIPSSLLLIDRRLKVVYANRNFLEKARRSAQSTIGRKISEVFPSVLVDYLSLDHQLKKAFSPSTGLGQGNGQGVQSGRLNYRTPGLSQRTTFIASSP